MIKRNTKKVKIMKKQKKLDLEVVHIGKPSIEALPEAEQKVFYKTLLNRIKQLAAEDDKKNSVINNEKCSD